jgi:regulator of protease activity HflC (stomatin/prohibitin superfamily)
MICAPELAAFVLLNSGRGVIIDCGPEGISNAGGLAGAVLGPGDPARHVPGVGMAGMFGFKIINQFEQGIVFRWGKALPGIRQPGLTWVNPVTDRLTKVNMQIVVAAVPAQEAITRDNVTLRVDAVVYYRVVDPVKAIINVQNYTFAVSQVAQTSLRSVIGQSDMDQLLSERDKVNAHLKDVIDAPTEQPWGIRVERVEVKDVSLPESMKRSMSRQAEAERERRARIISADGEYQASKKLAQAAAVMAADPAALQLRLLQTVAEVAAEKNSTLVMPVPVELLRFFDRAAQATGQARPAAAGIEEAPPDALEVPAPEVPALAVPPSLAAGPVQNAPLNGTPKTPATV